MKSITLDNGFIYQAFWGGHLVDPARLNIPEAARDIYAGTFYTPRQYHDLTKHTVSGIDWIEEWQRDPNFPDDRSCHHDWYSCDGHYHIARYHDDRGKPYHVVFQATTWRKNMQSTFGDYVQGIGSKEFNTFKQAARAAAKFNSN